MSNIELKKNYYYHIKPNNMPAFYGMFYSYDPETSNLMFIYNVPEGDDRIGTLSIDSNIVDSSSIIEPITREEWIYIMRTLISNGYYFEEKEGINLIYKPLTGKIAYFNNIATEESGFGAYVNSTGDRVLMFTYSNSKDIFYENLSYDIGNISDIYLKKPSIAEEKSFNELLSQYNKQWSCVLRRIIPTNKYRSNKGKPYYYINDRFTITYKNEDLSLTDNNRFNAGNYFISESEAQVIVQSFNEILMKRQASKEISSITETEIKSPAETFKTNDQGIIVKRKKGRPRKNG